jgi:hypothetical protein
LRIENGLVVVADAGGAAWSMPRADLPKELSAPNHLPTCPVVWSEQIPAGGVQYSTFYLLLMPCNLAAVLCAKVSGTNTGPYTTIRRT